MKMTLSWLFTSAAILLSAHQAALAQNYPNKSIRIVVPYSPGGPTDVLARLVGQKLGDNLGQSVVIENKPGASGVLGMEQVARAQPDGYTVLINASLHVIVPSLNSKLTIDPIKDFTPVSQFGTVPLIMVVNKSVAANSVADIVALAKANPGKLTFASSGVGASSHLAGEMLKTMAGIDMVHVPYKGSAPALNDVIAGHVAMMIDTTPASIGHVKAGNLKVLGVSAPKRLSVLPDVPTIAESGVPGYNVQSWYGVWLPAGTPAEIVKKLQTEIAKILDQPDMQQRFRDLGAEPTWSTPEDFDAFTRSELTRWAEVVRASGAKPE
jgi:tripartite-type tricarboxylate transporter receptor subunit TctC